MSPPHLQPTQDRAAASPDTDTLHEGDGTERALAERTAIFARRDELIGRAQTIAATYEAIAEVEDLISRGPGQVKAS
jgi:hypothetical protein